MANKENNKLKDLIKEYGIKDMNDVHNFVKMLMAETIQTALDAELDEELGYSKYDYKNKNTKNSRNGYSTKIVQSSNGEMELKIPRDRDGDFEPQLVKKHQTDISTIEDKVIFLYSQVLLLAVFVLALPKTFAKNCSHVLPHNGLKFGTSQDAKL